MFQNGWFFISTGIIGLLLGAYGTWAISHGYHLLSAKDNPSPQIDKTSITSHAQNGGQTAATIHDKTFIKRTPNELLSLYKTGLTRLQSGELMKPYIGLWIKTQGEVIDVGHGAPDGDQTAVILKDSNSQIECRFRIKWKNNLARLAKGDSVKINGKISPTQNGSQLYLVECEIP